MHYNITIRQCVELLLYNINYAWSLKCRTRSLHLLLNSNRLMDRTMNKIDITNSSQSRLQGAKFHSATGSNINGLAMKLIILGCEIILYLPPREVRRVAGREWTLGRPVPSLAPAVDGHWGCPLCGEGRVRGNILFKMCDQGVLTHFVFLLFSCIIS